MIKSQVMKTTSENSSSSTPSSTFTFESDFTQRNNKFSSNNNWFEYQKEVIENEIEEMLIKYRNWFDYLQKVFHQVNLLQEENLKLRDEHLDLSILVSAKEKEDSSVTRGGDDDVVVVPKVISVRSKMSDYVAMKKKNKDCLKATTGSTESKLVRLPAKSSNKDAGEVQVQVYKQGTTKTELCNKWEETGECTYGEKCRFAHGVDELRPVIRHPRYKTEVCHLITSADPCPYGHRCHFRHSFDPTQEKELVL